MTVLNNGLRDAMAYGNIDGVLLSFEVLSTLAVVFFVPASKLMSWKER